MKLIPHSHVHLKGGFLFDKQELNRRTTIHAVYDRFVETGRIGAFKFGYPQDDPIQPHFFWDSDVAKWIEGASYILEHAPDPVLEARIDEIVEDIRKNQRDDGYFNMYFTVVQPDGRWSNRDWHELYCAGHLMEAAVAYAEATGKSTFLSCMEKYADYIAKVFMEEQSAAFVTPGHEELELALVRMYRHTGKKKYLDMAAWFINQRGSNIKEEATDYNQSHAPVREQDSARGHAVRAMYLYTGMAYLAAETGDRELISACKKLWEDTVERKMYVTGGLGSTYIGEAFTTPYDLPPEQAYTETCAGIGLCLFGGGMLELENNAAYADVIERALYNGVTSGLSADGAQFFYENPLEINLSEHFSNKWGARRFPAHRRVACFACSCCPPNINRLLASVGNYVYGMDGDTLFANQFVASCMEYQGASAVMDTRYPNDGAVTVSATGVSRIAVRIPAWCDTFALNKPYVLQNGYAVIENDGTPVALTMDLNPRRVWADARVLRAANRVAIMKGPVVYCAEGVDNGEGELHNYVIPQTFTAMEDHAPDSGYGLPTITLPCLKRVADGGGLYRNTPPRLEETTLRLIPYNAFANRWETDMRVWFFAE